MRRLVLAMVLFVPFFLAGLNPARAADLEQVLERIQSRAAGVDTVQSAFIQEKHLDMFEEVLVSRGSFSFQRPDFLRWEYTEPVRSGFQVSGKEGLRWDENVDNGEVVQAASDPGLAIISEQLIAWVTFDLEWLESMYDITLLAESPIRLRLTPQSSTLAEIITHLDVEFSSDAQTVSQVELFESGGDSTRIQFLEPLVNHPLPSGM